MPVNNVPTMGWNRRSAAVSVLLVLEEQRRRAGQRTLQLREGRGWSQEDLAHAAKVSVKTVSRFENGKHEGRSRTVRAIAEALEVSEQELAGPPPAPLGLGETQLDRIEQALEQTRRALDLLLLAAGVNLPDAPAGGLDIPTDLDPPDEDAQQAG